MASRASQLFPMARLFAQRKACFTRTAAPFGGTSAATQRQSQQLARRCSRPSLLPSPSPLVAQCREFADALNEDTRERLNRLTKATRVVILMKGNPSQPRCGFSNAVCRILEAHGVLDKVDKNGTSIVSSFDVLEDNDIREGAKIFSDWPTFPQVYFDGEFVGGCDILLDMHRSGKLAAELNRLGIESKLSPEPPSSS